MKHQGIDPNPVTAVNKVLNKKIELYGRVTQRDMFSIMSAMSVGDVLCIANRQTGNNAHSMAWDLGIGHGKGFEIEEHRGCYWTVERSL